MEENKYRYFTLVRLNDKDVKFGRVKVTKKSGSLSLSFYYSVEFRETILGKDLVNT